MINSSQPQSNPFDRTFRRANHNAINASDVNVITVFEHQRLTARDFVSVSDFHWLMAQEFSVFTIKRKHGVWQLKVGHYIGVILLPSGMTLEVLPKLIAKGENARLPHQHRHISTQNSDIRQIRQWVQDMLADLTNSSDRLHRKLPNTKNLGQLSHQLTPLPLAVLPLPEWLIEQFLQRLAHYQPSKHYQAQTRNQASLQGRLLIKEQLRYNSMQPHKFMCESSVLNHDMLGNRLVKSALVLLRPLFSTVSSPISPSFLQVWQQVPTLTHLERQQLTSIYGRAKRQLASQPLRAEQLQAAQQLLDLAYWLLQQSNLGTGHSLDPQLGIRKPVTQLRLCLLVDMNQAFEQWASLRIASTFTQVSRQYCPLYQTQRVWLSDTEGQACLSIRPDLLIYKTTTDDNHQQGQEDIDDTPDVKTSGSYSHVIDIKWKHLSHAAAISASDAYQLTSYAQAYQAGQVWLVYPVQDDERQPVLLKQAVHNNNANDEPNHAQLWLIPFNVLTGTINSNLLPALNVV
ncbi:McrC family protein [Psychrobacter sp. AOP22-C1-C5]|uniref:McrC family protein n=1 Tax=Psychrobacter sp. AOP22-C1-C5 TaxID=3457716 RepID=UPI0040354CD2